jgi:hypothetical protein
VLRQTGLALNMEARYAGEWFDPTTGERQPAQVSQGDGRLAVQPSPWPGDAVLLLQSER